MTTIDDTVNFSAAKLLVHAHHIEYVTLLEEFEGVICFERLLILMQSMVPMVLS